MNLPLQPGTVLPLEGIFRPRKSGPGFGIPIFVFRNTFWVQEIEGRLVKGFRLCDVERENLRKARPQPLAADALGVDRRASNRPIEQAQSEAIVDAPWGTRVRVGEPALFAFETADGELKMGRFEELAPWLRARVAELRATPFVLYDVAKFVHDESLSAEAKELCRTVLQQSRPKVITQPYEKTVPLLVSNLSLKALFELFWRWCADTKPATRGVREPSLFRLALDWKLWLDDKSWSWIEPPRIKKKFQNAVEEEQSEFISWLTQWAEKEFSDRAATELLLFQLAFLEPCREWRQLAKVRHHAIAGVHLGDPREPWSNKDLVWWRTFLVDYHLLSASSLSPSKPPVSGVQAARECRVIPSELDINKLLAAVQRLLSGGGFGRLYWHWLCKGPVLRTWSWRRWFHPRHVLCQFTTGVLICCAFVLGPFGQNLSQAWIETLARVVFWGLPALIIAVICTLIAEWRLGTRGGRELNSLLESRLVCVVHEKKSDRSLVSGQSYCLPLCLSVIAALVKEGSKPSSHSLWEDIHRGLQKRYVNTDQRPGDDVEYPPGIGGTGDVNESGSVSRVECLPAKIGVMLDAGVRSFLCPVQKEARMPANEPEMNMWWPEQKPNVVKNSTAWESRLKAVQRLSILRQTNLAAAVAGVAWGRNGRALLRPLRGWFMQCPPVKFTAVSKYLWHSKAKIAKDSAICLAKVAYAAASCALLAGWVFGFTDLKWIACPPASPIFLSPEKYTVEKVEAVAESSSRRVIQSQYLRLRFEVANPDRWEVSLDGGGWWGSIFRKPAIRNAQNKREGHVDVLQSSEPGFDWAEPQMTIERSQRFLLWQLPATGRWTTNVPAPIAPDVKPIRK